MELCKFYNELVELIIHERSKGMNDCFTQAFLKRTSMTVLHERSKGYERFLINCSQLVRRAVGETVAELE